MPDPSFFQTFPPLSLLDLAKHCSFVFHESASENFEISGAAPLNRAKASEVTFLSDPRYTEDLKITQAGAIFIQQEQASLVPESCHVLITAKPQAAFALAASRFYQPITHSPGSPSLHPDAILGDDVKIAPGVVIGQKARIGRGTQIGANAVIGPGVHIGEYSLIGSNASIGFAVIGNHVRIYPNAVIGAEGFGVTDSQAGAVDIPQLGRVIIADYVTIGANACIDRGAFDDTLIGERSKIDNLVQIGHNVQLGRNCLLAAHTGLSGSVIVGDGTIFGGRAGVADHITIGSKVRIAAAAGVMKNIPDAETWAGTPARPIKRFMRETAWLTRQVTLSKSREK